MNNAQFRKLLETARAERGSDGTSPSRSSGPAATPALGSKLRPSIPMTPRSLFTHTDFQHQLAERNAPPEKKFKSSSAPKGAKLGVGYVDRAKLREVSAETDAEIADRERRMQALIEVARDPETGKVDMDLVIAQSKAMGGDVKSTHLVKGLDFALLERVKKGEDVMGLRTKKEEGARALGAGQGEGEEKLEEELDKALEKEVVAVEKEKVKKVGKKPTREELLAELKRQRAEAKAAKESAAAVTPPISSLGSRFKKIGQPKEKKVKEGKPSKKKARDNKEAKIEAKANAPLGMLPPTLPTPTKAKPKQDDDEDIDIFDGVGTDYDPLAGLKEDGDSDSDSSEDEEEKQKIPKAEECQESKETPPDIATTPLATSSMSPPLRQKINYFNEKEDEEDTTYKPPTSTAALLTQNPDLAAALAKAAKLASLDGSSSSATPEELEKEKRRKAMLEGFDRDAMDLDMGFGGARDWGEDDEEYVEKGGKKRKRGKKKGDKNDAELVGRIVKEKYGDGKR